ncbi:SMP-30/gluconolactonase/LRE family protein [Algoriphagus machipongonensis]|uniref:Regucalcin (RC) n=1 Tax=Algoriphagus machipongonensis TaxID=388413 RepID=A3HW30_9BACT|nr:SMP-30/gluconolactonase/LRE family protein [Algoriphagus machipongonensis]EAZ82352.1 regucalcin (RC) [Algoriphagus machipongonensis]
MKTYNYTSIPSQCFLAEGPYWHSDRQSFFWVDIENGNLFEHSPKSGDTNTINFPHRLTVVLEGKENELILGLDCKLAKYHLESKELTWIAEVEQEFPLHRFNDGKVDPKGRIWIGTLSTLFTESAGSLYRVGKDLKPVKQLDQLTISNGMAWTEDNQTFYFIDTPTREIKAFSFDLESGYIRFERIAVEIPEELGFPDGMCIDQEGMLWVAHYGGFGVIRWDPTTGEMIDKIELPVPHVTSCCFGGENLDTLLITTAQENLSEQQLLEYPMSGDVFMVKTNTRGFEANKYHY